ncbi:MAG: ARPP-1 family domain-containing protein [Solirubrobacterales bacterium]
MPTETAENPNTIAAQLAEPLEVGDPDIAGPLAVFPLFGPEPGREYRAYADAVADGVEIRELPGGASVNNLVIDNPTEHEVLLFEGEEVLGAQQNRSVDITVLAPSRAKVTVPVSCVEAGRWDGARHDESMRQAPQASNPRMRRMKSVQVRARAMAGAEARADQGAVWEEADRLADDYGADAPTRATHDVFESRRHSLDELCNAIALHDKQIGAIASYGGELQVLDLVSRPTAFASLHRRIVQGYALDALGSGAGLDTAPAETAAGRGFALLVCDSEIAQRERGVGVGENVRFAANGVAGSGLVAEGELIQLTAFPGDESDQDFRRTVPQGRIRRPSRRR